MERSFAVSPRLWRLLLGLLTEQRVQPFECDLERVGQDVVVLVRDVRQPALPVGLGLGLPAEVDALHAPALAAKVLVWGGRFLRL